MNELTGKKVLPTKLLVVEPIPEEKKTQSGLILIEGAEKITSMGTVVLVGEGTTALPMPVKAGHRVMFPPRAGVRVKTEEGVYLLLNITDILLYW